MFRTVCEQLEVLGEVYGQLLRLAEEKEPVLQANKDLEAIRRFTGQEERLMLRAARAERLRMEAVGGIAQELGVAPDSLTISVLAGHAGPSNGEALLKAAQALAEVIRRLQAQNEMNRQLLEMNMSFATFLLDSMAREESLSSMYAASGEEAKGPAESSRLLDSEI